MTNPKGNGPDAGNDRPAKNTTDSTDSSATAQKRGNSPYGPDFVRISPQAAQRRMREGIPGVMIVSYAHDAWCRTRTTGNFDDCICNPDEAYWLDKGGKQ